MQTEDFELVLMPRWAAVVYLMAAVVPTVLPGRSAAADIPASVVPEAPATVQDKVLPW